MTPPEKRGEKSTKGELSLRLVIVMAMASCVLAVTMYGTQPSWWVSRGAVNTGATTNDYAAVNQGQLKEFAFKAANELNANLPGYGAGTNLNHYVFCWTNDYATNGYNATNLKPADFQVMRVGQVKAIAGYVWQQLVAAGYTNNMPSWLDVNSSDTQVANIGQIKTVFNFDLLYDSDTNGLPDWWEKHYFGAVGTISGNSPAPNGHGMTVLEAYEDGVSPTDYYNGTLPTLSIVSGTGQSGPSGAVLANPLVIAASSGTTVLQNAPITFSVLGGYGQVATGSTGSLASSQNVATGTNGHAFVYLAVGGSTGAVNTVEAVATSGTNTTSVTFTATVTGTYTGSTPAIGSVGATQVAGGGDYGGIFSIGLRSDGTVWTWGDNTYGELGNGTTSDSNTPVQVSGLSNIVQVSAGDGYGLALKSDGTVWAWGANWFGALGNGTANNSSSAAQIAGLSGIVRIAAGAYHALALKSDGTVWAWGSNSNGQLGHGTTTDSYSPVQVGGLSRAISIAAGAEHSLASDAFGNTWAWGSNASGQLGNGTITDSSSPIQVYRLGIVTAVAAGDVYSLAVKSDGTVQAWGSNWAGQLGNGTTTDSATPVAVSGLSGIVSLSAGYGNAMAVDGSGNLWAWGYNADGELGNGSLNNASTPAEVSGITSPASISAGGYHTLVLNSGGAVQAWGYNGSGQLGTQLVIAKLSGIPVPNLSGISNGAAGGYHGLALTSSGTVWAWGSNSNGQLGNGGDIDSSVPVAVSGSNFTAVSAGAYHSLALSSGSTVWAWGYNGDGELGSGTDADSDTPVQSGTINNIVAISAGQYHSLALTSSGTVWAWGYDQDGELGDSGTEGFSESPIAVASLSGVTAVSGGGYHSLAIKSNGTVWAWGADWYGQLGDSGTESFSGSAVAVSGLSGTATAVSAGQYHSLALRSDGTVWAWGYNGDGELGNGTATDSGTAVQVSLSGTATAIAAGSGFSLAVRSDGTVWAWGDNSSGQFGNGNTTGSLVPVQIPWLGGISKVYAGAAFAMAVKSDGTVFAWGDNSSAQIGIGTNGPQVVSPQQVLSLSLSSHIVPGASLSSPSNGAIVATGTTVTLTATGTVSSGSLSKIEFFQEGVKIGESSTSPYQMTWSATTWGNFDFSVIATDSAGSKSTQSQVVTVDVFSETTYNDGLPDWWVSEYFGGTGVSASALSPNGDGLTNLQNYLTGINPLDYYNGGLPTLSIVSGNGQSGTSSQVLPNPLVVQATGSSGNLLVGAPVQFGISGSYGQIATSATGSFSASQTVVTGTAGTAEVYFKLTGTTNGTVDTALATATSGTNSTSVTFSATTLVATSGSSSSNLNLVSGGYYSGAFTLGVKADGTVWGWGTNTNGQLGNGTYLNSTTPVKIPGLSGIRAASAGDQFALGLDAFGRVWQWGNLGVGTTVPTAVPGIVAGASNIVSVAAGQNHALALDTSGTVLAWGDNAWGELGDGSSYSYEATPVQTLGPGNVTAIAAGYGYSLAVKSDGTVWAWGSGYTAVPSTPVQVGGLSGTMTAVSAAPDGSVLALDSTGTVWSWDGTANPPATVSGLSGIAFVNAGIGGSGFAIDSGGNVWSWAFGGATPMEVAGISNVTQVSVANVVYGGCTLALTSSGAIYGWGDMSLIGNGTPESTQTVIPIPAFSGSVQSAATGNAHALAVNSAGQVWAWGYGGDGELGTGTNSNSPVPIEVSGSFTATRVAAGYAHSLAIDSSGGVRAWGDNSWGQLGSGTATGSVDPQTISGLGEIMAIAAGAYHSLALKSDGTIWGWGYDWDGELGDGAPDISENTPVESSGSFFATAIAAGDYHSLAIDTTGTVWAWGAGGSGQLGNGSTSGTTVPTAVSGLSGTISAIAAGSDHSLALVSGTVWAWGSNWAGQLGNGSGEDSSIPVAASGLSSVTAIGAAGNTSFAVKSDGTLWVWGDNGSGQFGNGTSTGSNVPVQVPWFAGVSKVFVGASGFAVAQKSDGSLAAWGNNSSGQIGINVQGARTSSPQMVLGVNLGTNAVPSVSLVAPVSGTFIPSGTTIPIQASVVAGSGTISKVEFYQEGVKIGESDTTPYQMTFSASTWGTMQLTAVATDSAGSKSLKSASSTLNVIVDINHNGLPDWWETEFLTGTGNTASTPAPNGDGLTLLENYIDWINPGDYFNGIVPQLQVMSGDGQVGPANIMFPGQLVVRVTGSDGNPLVSAPVLFSVASGGGMVAASGTGSLATSQTVITGTNGLAWAFLTPGGTTSGTTANQVVASVTTGSQTVSGTFTEQASPIGSPSVPAAPVVSASVDTSLTSVTLAWSDSSTDVTGYTVEVSNDGGITWQTLATLSGSDTTYTGTGLIPGTSPIFAVIASNAGGNSTPGGTNGSPVSPGSPAPSGPTTPDNPPNPPPTSLKGFPCYAVIDLGQNIRPSKITNSGYILIDPSGPPPASFAAVWHNGKTITLQQPGPYNDPHDVFASNIDEDGTVIGTVRKWATYVHTVIEEGTVYSSGTTIGYPHVLAIWPADSVTPTLTDGPVESFSTTFAYPQNYWSTTDTGQDDLVGVGVDNADGVIFSERTLDLDFPQDLFKNSQEIGPGVVSGTVISTDSLCCNNNSGDMVRSEVNYLTNLTTYYKNDVNLTFVPTCMSNRVTIGGATTVYVAGYDPNNINQLVWWNGTDHSDSRFSSFAIARGINAELVTLTVSGSLVTKPAIQIMDWDKIIKMDMTTGNFGYPQNISDLILNSQYTSFFCPGKKSLNDSGMMIGEAYYQASPNSPLVWHGVLLVPVALTNKADPTVRNGANGNDMPIQLVATSSSGTVTVTSTNSVAWIAGNDPTNGNAPRMPHLEANIAAPVGIAVEWKLQVVFHDRNGNPHRDFDTGDPNNTNSSSSIDPQDSVTIPLPTASSGSNNDNGWRKIVTSGSVSGVWDVFSDSDYLAEVNSKGFFGGDATLSVRIKSSDGSTTIMPEQDYKFRIAGENPTPVSCRAYITTQYGTQAVPTVSGTARDTWQGFWMAAAIAKEETNGVGSSHYYNQFTDSGGYGQTPLSGHEGYPAWHDDGSKDNPKIGTGGYGLYQLTHAPPNDDDYPDMPRKWIWNWQENVKAVRQEWEPDLGKANTLYSGLTSNYSGDCGTIPKEGQFSGLEAIFLTYYNGMSGNQIQSIPIDGVNVRTCWYPNTFRGIWTFLPNKQNYVNLVNAVAP